MTWQGIAAGAIVAGALVYLVWKLGFRSRTPKRKRVDVPASALVRKKRE
ncbi:MAG: hypothetical protein AAGE52_05730 [Myxococcota bacterium]